MKRIERLTSPLPRECSTTELHRRNRFRSVADDPAPPCDANRGAGEGNRTLVISLEGFCSTIELHPPALDRSVGPSPLDARGGGGRIRTYVGAWPTDLQSAPFSRSGTPPNETRDYRGISLWCQTPRRSAQIGPGRTGRVG